MYVGDNLRNYSTNLHNSLTAQLEAKVHFLQVDIILLLRKPNREHECDSS